MTAINCVVVPGGSAGFLLTDSLAYDRRGNIDGFGAKTITLPHAHCCVASRGEALVAGMAAMVVGRFSDIDQISTMAPAALTTQLREFVDTLILDGEPAKLSIEMVVMGWSPMRKTVEAYLAKSEDDFSFRSVNIYLAPALSAEELINAGIPNTDGGIRFTNLVEDLCRILATQSARRYAADPSRPDDKASLIGGDAILTRIDRSGVHQCKLMRIDPAKGC